jgi:hypothetical protein
LLTHALKPVHGPYGGHEELFYHRLRLSANSVQAGVRFKFLSGFRSRHRRAGWRRGESTQPVAPGGADPGSPGGPRPRRRLPAEPPKGGHLGAPVTPAEAGAGACVGLLDSRLRGNDSDRGPLRSMPPSEPSCRTSGGEGTCTPQKSETHPQSVACAARCAYNGANRGTQPLPEMVAAFAGGPGVYCVGRRWMVP